MFDRRGTILKHVRIGHAQTASVGKYLPDRPGLQLMCVFFFLFFSLTPVVIPLHCARRRPLPQVRQAWHSKAEVPPQGPHRLHKAVAFLEITCGEYRARCGCCTTFRNTPEQVLPRALYDNKVRDLVLERLIEDGMSIERTLKSLRREYLLELSTGFVYDVLHDRARQLDMAEHRREVLGLFSGTLCVDELHLGRFTLLLATDPLADLPVAFALVEGQRPGPHAAVPAEPQELGLDPRGRGDRRLEPVPGGAGRTVVRRGHQLCVFHVLKDINKLVLDAVRRLRTAMTRRGKAGRKRKRGRKGAKSKAAAARRGLTLKEKAHLRVQAPSSDREAARELHRGGA